MSKFYFKQHGLVWVDKEKNSHGKEDRLRLRPGSQLRWRGLVK